jgi:hypothetical protein
MKKDLFDELLESVREGGEILRGERKAAQRFQFDTPDVADQGEEAGGTPAVPGNELRS